MGSGISKEQQLEIAKQHLAENRLDRALAEYQRILQSDPSDQRVRLRLAELYVRLKHIKQAIDTYQQVAVAYAAEGFFLKAVTVYKNILKLNPVLHEANRALAELYEKMGLYADAVHQYRIVLRGCEERGDRDEALELRKRIVGLDPENVTSRIRLAEMYQVHGQADASLHEFEVLAEQLRTRGTEEQQIDLYTKILSRRPEHLEILRRLCDIYTRRQDWRAMLHWMAHGAKLVAGDAPLLRMQAKAFAALNQTESARTKFRELAEWYVRAEQPEDAIAAYEEWLVVSPEGAEELREPVEQLREGAFDDIMESADIRRAEAAAQAAEPPAAATPAAAAVVQREVQAAARASRGAERPTAEPPTPARTAVQWTQQIDAAHALAQAYANMNMPDEAAAEWRKVRVGLQVLLDAGVATSEQQQQLAALQARETA